MIDNFRQISVLNKVFNLGEGQWSRVSFAWVMRLLYRVGFVVGWTVIVALFTSRYGITSLPYLFVANAFLSVLGSLFFSTLIDRFKKSNLMILSLLLAGVTLFVSALFFTSGDVGFFVLLLLAEAVFLVQFKILQDGYIEEMFNSLESERSFPLIETAETIGGILAGIMVVSLSNVMDLSNFIFFWVATVFLIIPVLLFYEDSIKDFKTKRVSEYKKTKSHKGLFVRIKKELSNSNKVSFLKGLFVMVFCQWLLYSLLEFQYTKAVYRNVSGMILETGSGFEHAFIHDLGVFFILFSVSALLVQLFVNSRLLSSLGIVSSMIIHPIVALLSLFSLTLSFNFYVAVFAKNNFNVTTTVFTNAYHSAYYAVKEKFREYTREFLEGIVRPSGALLGTLMLILMQQIFNSAQMIAALNVLMLVVAAVFFFVVKTQQKNYTQIALSDLAKSNDKDSRINAVDILAQKGHTERTKHELIKVLLDKSDLLSVRVRILRAFAEFEDDDLIDPLMQSLSSEKEEIRNAALDTLFSYGWLFKSKKEHLLIKNELIEKLKSLYEKEDCDDFKAKIMLLLSKLSEVSAVNFLLDILKGKNSRLRSDAIFALGHYNDELVAEYLEPFLKSKKPRERINAAISLAKFKKYSPEALNVVYSFVFSENNSKKALGIYAVGEIGLKQFADICEKGSCSNVVEIRIQSAIALAKMGKDSAIPVLVALLFHNKNTIKKRVKSLLRNVDVRIFKNVDRIVRSMVRDAVDKMLEEERELNMQNLKWMYCLVEEYDEVEMINKMSK